MKRKNLLNRFNVVGDYRELNKRTAIHEAGHAVAIYFGNKQKHLPPVFFQIVINDYSHHSDDHFQPEIEGGRLIHTLPVFPAFIEKFSSNLSAVQQRQYQQAVEADIINLLVGPLAEAHYIAHRDNELINPRLLPVQALHNYGGSFDLELVDQYLKSFIADKQQQDTKLIELFELAFDFVDKNVHWCAITLLADYILKSAKSIISYEEIDVVLTEYFAKCHSKKFGCIESDIYARRACKFAKIKKLDSISHDDNI
jgi:hypothetical protein